MLTHMNGSCLGCMPRLPSPCYCVSQWFTVCVTPGKPHSHGDQPHSQMLGIHSASTHGVQVSVVACCVLRLSHAMLPLDLACRCPRCVMSPAATHDPWQGREAILKNLDLTRRQAMDRYTQHVQHCAECKAALSRTQAIAATAAAAAVGAFVAACLVASVRATAALAPAAVPAWVAGVASWGVVADGGSGVGGVLGLCGPLLLLGLAAVGVHFLAKKLEGLFFYREYDRPAF